MFAIMRIFVSSAAGTESLYFTKWLCSAQLGEGSSVLLEGSSSHDTEDDTWNSDANLRHPLESESGDTEQIALLEFEMEQACAFHVGAEIHARLMDGTLTPTQFNA
ncbi:hypothetical protein [Roseateles sp. BYS96W]|uniref:hypothetical protein n=1 Tax=Pelomonas nitida TaxID=3299027 RepID=UPI003747A7BE